MGISNDFKELLIQIENSDGEISDEIDKAMEQLSLQLQTKTDGVAAWIRTLENQIKICDNEILRIKEFKDAYINQLDKFKAYVVMCMDRLGEVKLLGDTSQLAIRKPAKVVHIENEDDIPLEFIKTQTITKTSIDKVALKQALKGGEKIPGAKLANGLRKLAVK